MATKGKKRAESPDRPAGRTRAAAFPPKRKSCALCRDHVREVDYKDVDKLRRYTSDRGKIRSRRMTGACRKHQRQVAVAVKRAREMALLPYIGANDAPPSRARSGGRREP
jgi:small subunit ribosomal protein S18